MLANADSRPLLRRSPLFPGESLPSYLSRLVIANCYEPVSLFTTICNKRLAKLGIKDNLERPTHPETFDMLVSLTGLEPRELANASIHRFAQAPFLSRMKRQAIYLSDGLPFLLLERPIQSRYLWRKEGDQFCPECLREAAYHRLSWVSQDVSACLDHQCLLATHCRDCNAGVSVRSIVQRRCEKCGGDLADVALHGIRDDSLGLFAQQTIQLWWGLIDPPPDHPGWALPEQPVPVLHHLFERLAGSSEIKWQREYPRRSVNGPSDRFIIQKMAFAALVDWPRGFHEFLRDWLEYEVLLHSYRHCYDFREPAYLRTDSSFAFWVSSFEHSSGFEFAQEAVDQFLVENDVQVHHDSLNGHTRIRVKADARLQQIAHRIARRELARLHEALSRL